MIAVSAGVDGQNGPEDRALRRPQTGRESYRAPTGAASWGGISSLSPAGATGGLSASAGRSGLGSVGVRFADHGAAHRAQIRGARPRTGGQAASGTRPPNA